MKTLLACVLLMTVISGCSKDCEDDPNDCEINLNQGLVAYYPFNGNADDASGNGNNGVVYGATFTTDFLGRPGKAAGFDGINDYILVNDNGKLNHQEVTIAMMVMVNNTNRRQAIINRVESRAVDYVLRRIHFCAVLVWTSQKQTDSNGDHLIPI